MIMDINTLTLNEIRELKDILAKELVEVNRANAKLFEDTMGIKFDAVVEIKPCGTSSGQSAEGETAESYDVSIIIHFDGEDL